MEIDEEGVCWIFYEFNREGSNMVDMIRCNRTEDFESWDNKKYVKLDKDNPVKFLNSCKNISCKLIKTANHRIKCSIM